MSKYRILEKKGEYKLSTASQSPFAVSLLPSGDRPLGPMSYPMTEYIPRYIVQSLTDYPPEVDFNSILKDPNCLSLIEGYEPKQIKDLKEFNNLDEARKYKRDLELEEGIVVE